MLKRPPRFRHRPPAPFETVGLHPSSGRTIRRCWTCADSLGSSSDEKRLRPREPAATTSRPAFSVRRWGSAGLENLRRSTGDRLMRRGWRRGAGDSVRLCDADLVCSAAAGPKPKRVFHPRPISSAIRSVRTSRGSAARVWAQQHVAQISERINPGQFAWEHSPTRSPRSRCAPAPRKQPVVAVDHELPDLPLRVTVVGRRERRFGVAGQCLPGVQRVTGRFARRTARQNHQRTADPVRPATALNRYPSMRGAARPRRSVVPAVHHRRRRLP